MAAGKKHDNLGNSIIERALAETEGKKLDISKRTIEPKWRRSRVEIERDDLIKLIEHFAGLEMLIPSLDPSDAAIDLLTKEQNAFGVENSANA